MADKHLTVFVAYLALGILAAVAEHATPLETAEVPLDRFHFWKPIEAKIDSRVLAVLQGIGDLYLPGESSLGHVEPMIADLRMQLLQVLSETDMPTWHGRWIVAGEGAEEEPLEASAHRRIDAGLPVPPGLQAKLRERRLGPRAHEP